MIDAYRCKLNLEYDNQKFEFIGKLADQSPSQGDTKYVAEAHLTHPASHLDVQFTSQLTNNIEKIGSNMEVKYMMTRDRQLRSNALRAEINKIREELNLEASDPHIVICCLHNHQGSYVGFLGLYLSFMMCYLYFIWSNRLTHQ